MSDRSKLLALAEADRIKDEEMTLREAVRGVARRRKQREVITDRTQMDKPW